MNFSTKSNIERDIMYKSFDVIKKSFSNSDDYYENNLKNIKERTIILDNELMKFGENYINYINCPDKNKKIRMQKEIKYILNYNENLRNDTLIYENERHIIHERKTKITINKDQIVTMIKKLYNIMFSILHNRDDILTDIEYSFLTIEYIDLIRFYEEY
jgi:hypothetical protein